MRKDYTTISITKDLFEKIEAVREKNPFYASAGEFCRRAIENLLNEVQQ